MTHRLHCHPVPTQCTDGRDCPGLPVAAAGRSVAAGTRARVPGRSGHAMPASELPDTGTWAHVSIMVECMSRNVHVQPCFAATHLERCTAVQAHHGNRPVQAASVASGLRCPQSLRSAQACAQACVGQPHTAPDCVDPLLVQGVEYCIPTPSPSALRARGRMQLRG